MRNLEVCDDKINLDLSQNVTEYWKITYMDAFDT